MEIGEREMDRTLQWLRNVNSNKVKNVNSFVGDGMSQPTVTAARCLSNQRLQIFVTLTVYIFVTFKKI
jgi:alkaline phosphatase